MANRKNVGKSNCQLLVPKVPPEKMPTNEYGFYEIGGFYSRMFQHRDFTMAVFNTLDCLAVAGATWWQILKVASNSYDEGLAQAAITYVDRGYGKEFALRCSGDSALFMPDIEIEYWTSLIGGFNSEEKRQEYLYLLENARTISGN